MAVIENEKEIEELNFDTVNHPFHYTSGKIECIDVMEDIFGKEAVKNFCHLNAFKYIWRANNKHETPEEDIEKAIWYLKKEIEILNKL